MNIIFQNLSHSENDLITSTNNNSCRSQTHGDTTESIANQPGHLISEEIELSGRYQRGETSIRIDYVSNESTDSHGIGKEELMQIESINKKLDYFERKFERIERAIVHLTEYLTK